MDADSTILTRSGRTARYHKAGNSLAMLLPSEEKMVTKLQNSGVSLTKIRVNPQKQVFSGGLFSVFCKLDLTEIICKKLNYLICYTLNFISGVSAKESSGALR